MKLLLDIQDDKASFFIELLKNFKYVKAKPFEEESQYNPEFVKKILDGEKARKSGKKGLKVDVNHLWK